MNGVSAYEGALLMATRKEGPCRGCDTSASCRRTPWKNYPDVANRFTKIGSDLIASSFWSIRPKPADMLCRWKGPPVGMKKFDGRLASQSMIFTVFPQLCRSSACLVRAPRRGDLSPFHVYSNDEVPSKLRSRERQVRVRHNVVVALQQRGQKHQKHQKTIRC